MIKNELLQEWAEHYILGGNAMVVFLSDAKDDKPQVSKRFRVVADYGDDWRAKSEKDRSKIIYWKVFSLDTSPKKEFVGKILPSHIFENHTKFIGGSSQPTELSRNFAFVWNHIKNRTLPKEYHILHLGSCSVCSRPLTDPESIRKGIGPICEARIGQFTNLPL